MLKLWLEPGSINCTCCQNIKGCRNISEEKTDNISDLTKREYFAAMAMQGLLAAQSGEFENGGWPIHTQRTAVLIADALIEELNK